MPLKNHTEFLISYDNGFVGNQWCVLLFECYHLLCFSVSRCYEEKEAAETINKQMMCCHDYETSHCRTCRSSYPLHFDEGEDKKAKKNKFDKTEKNMILPIIFQQVSLFLQLCEILDIAEQFELLYDKYTSKPIRIAMFRLCQDIKFN